MLDLSLVLLYTMFYFNCRGPNVSILHLRTSTEPWETTTTSTFSSSTTHTAKSYFSRGAASSLPPLTKHQSLVGPSGAYKWQNSPSFHTTAEVNSPEMFVGIAKRELSPVRWHDREVDGVYLNKSGWVQVEQRSLDESKRLSSVDLTKIPPKRVPGKLTDYHFNSEPGSERPSVLSFQSTEYIRKSASPSPPLESPSLTPIISPPPAFQDKVEKDTEEPNYEKLKRLGSQCEDIELLEQKRHRFNMHKMVKQNS
ncbi:unnamed protein product [Diabrotica balteata]|uniref:Uncharacterized protein n=1 Tax=Diabrotica balteata TaxID=107213 RepID=A0A9N9X8S6_DIABA|nr:unnamed protein product [Diabrotica balteata]